MNQRRRRDWKWKAASRLFCQPYLVCFAPPPDGRPSVATFGGYVGVCMMLKSVQRWSFIVCSCAEV